MSDIKLKAASGGGSISLKGPSTSGSDDDFLDTSGNVRVSGRFLLGTNDNSGYSNRSAFFHKTSGSNFVSITSDGSNSAGLVFGDGVAQNSNNYESYMAHNNSNNIFSIFTNQGNKQFNFKTDGELELQHGNLKIGNAGSGIDFSAASGSAAGSASALLDDYEEGTLAPVITGQTSAGSGTYSTNDGWYTKVGRLVNYWFYISWDNHDGTGNMQVTLPFACSNNSGGTMNATGSIMLHNIDLSANTVGLAAYTWHGSSVFQIYEMHDNAGWAPTAVDSGGGMIGSLSYMAA